MTTPEHRPGGGSRTQRITGPHGALDLSPPAGSAAPETDGSGDGARGHGAAPGGPSKPARLSRDQLLELAADDAEDAAVAILRQHYGAEDDDLDTSPATLRVQADWLAMQVLGVINEPPRRKVRMPATRAATVEAITQAVMVARGRLHDHADMWDHVVECYEAELGDLERQAAELTTLDRLQGLLDAGELHLVQILPTESGDIGCWLDADPDDENARADGAGNTAEEALAAALLAREAGNR